MNSAAHDIALYLESKGVGKFGKLIFVNTEPADPDSCITVFDYPGGGHDTDDLDRLPNFQVRTRSKDNLWANNQQETIMDLLINADGYFASATSNFSVVALNSDIASLGRDGNQRIIMVASYRARRTKKET